MKMQSTPTGGPAFPDRIYRPFHVPPQRGLTVGVLLGLTVSLNAWPGEGTLVGPPEGCGRGCNFLSFSPAGNEFHLSGQFPRNPSPEWSRWTSVYWGPGLPQRASWTTELKLDMLSASVDATGTADEVFTVFGADTWPTPRGEGGYAICKDANEIALFKYHTEGNPFTILFWEEREIKHEQITLVLSMTWLASGVRVTARVEDLEHGGRTLYERSFLDGPGVDAVVEDPHFKGVNAWQDDNGSGYSLTNCWLGVWDLTPGDISPSIGVAAGNLRYTHMPYLDVNQAVCLSWPLTDGEFVVEAAPTLEGPWEEVTPGATSVDADRQQVWVLADEQARFFRLREVETP